MNLNASTQSISQPMKNKGSTYAPDFPADCRTARRALTPGKLPT
jgi:hypothetical protein